MGHGISEILTFAVGVAISPVPIIAVTLMLFSQRARVNGLMFLLGWVVRAGPRQRHRLRACRPGQRRHRQHDLRHHRLGENRLRRPLSPAGRAQLAHPTGPGAEPEMPKWMAGIDALKPGKALGLGLLLAGVNPKNLMLAAAAGAGLAALGLSSANAIGSLIVFVVIASLTIAGPVVYYLLGGDDAKARLDEMKNWLALHNNAVMATPIPRLRRQADRRWPATPDLKSTRRTS